MAHSQSVFCSHPVCRHHGLLSGEPQDSDFPLKCSLLQCTRFFWCCTEDWGLNPGPVCSLGYHCTGSFTPAPSPLCFYLEMECSWSFWEDYVNLRSSCLSLQMAVLTGLRFSHASWHLGCSNILHIKTNHTQLINLKVAVSQHITQGPMTTSLTYVSYSSIMLRHIVAYYFFK